jgi:hypothetical protein
MNNHDAGVSAEEKNRYLENNYRYSLTQFENSLLAIKTYYKLISRKKGIPEIRRRIDYLQSSKESLVRKIDGFLTKSRSWEWIKHNFASLGELTEEQRANFVRSKFHLNYYYKFVDIRIEQLNRLISFATSINFHTENMRKRVRPETMIILVWTLAFRNHGANGKKSYRETKDLWAWFRKNKGGLLSELFGQPIDIGLDTIRRDFERYIQNPLRGKEVYGELAKSLCSQSFGDYGS